MSFRASARREASALGVHTSVGIRPAAPAGAASPPYTPPNAPRERPLPLPLGEVAERSEDGEGKQKRTASGRFFSLSINPLYASGSSFTQGELEGAKPASN